MREREAESTSRNFLFVGVDRSETARKKGYTWQNVPPEGVLCAKKLFTALRAIGIDPQRQDFTNILDDGGNPQEILPNGHVVVAMGLTVQKELDRRGIPYIGIIHPAALGGWCRQDQYNQHIEHFLSGTFQKLNYAANGGDSIIGK